MIEFICCIQELKRQTQGKNGRALPFNEMRLYKGRMIRPMKKTIAVLLLVLLLSGITAYAENPIETDDMEGISLELLGMRFEDKTTRIVIPEVMICNQTGKDIMTVFYEMTFFDADGKELGVSRMFYAVDDPLPDGGSALQNNSRFVLNLSEVPDHATIQVLSYMTTEEVPPIHVPKEGEYLYEALNCENLNSLPDLVPTKITVNVERMGYEQRAVFEAGSGLEEAVEAFLKIRIGEDNAPMVTDNYNWFLFEWEDGTSYMIRLNLYALEYKTNTAYHSFYLQDAGDFWMLAYANLS